MSKGIAVVAVGGNALIRDSAHTALDDLYDAVCATAAHVVDMVAAGWNVVVTHGNGPQVGFILRRSGIGLGARDRALCGRRRGEGCRGGQCDQQFLHPKSPHANRRGPSGSRGESPVHSIF